MAQHDLQRFERIVLPYLDDAYTLARYLVRDVHDAQDVVQDAVLRALRHFDGFRGGDARAWLLAIVRNCCATWYARERARRQDVPLTENTAGAIDEMTEADAVAIRRSERAAIERALEALPAEFREVIVLREIQELSYKEIGEVIGVPIGTVMSRLARARRRLAIALGAGVREAS